MSAPHDPWERVRALRPNPYSHSNYYVAEEVDAARAADAVDREEERARWKAHHDEMQKAAEERASRYASEIATLRATVDQQQKQIAELHDIVSGYNAITDPEAFPELDARAGRVLGSESNGDCGNSICKALMAAEQLVDQQQARITELEQARDEAQEWADMLGRGTSPCGHWKAYTYQEDPKGARLNCWQCRAEKAEARITALEAALEFYANPFGRVDADGEPQRVPEFYSEMEFGEVARTTLERTR